MTGQNASPPRCTAAGLALDADAVAAHLCRLLEAGDVGGVAAVLGNVARARGMAQVARDAGLSREALYRALRPASCPRLDTIVRVCTALGLRLTAHPIDPMR
jgi:probable addiction module antidote protein